MLIGGLGVLAPGRKHDLAKIGYARDDLWNHNEDAMVVEKLSEGIRNFYIDQVKLETLLKSLG